MSAAYIDTEPTLVTLHIRKNVHYKKARALAETKMFASDRTKSQSQQSNAMPKNVLEQEYTPTPQRFAMKQTIHTSTM